MDEEGIALGSLQVQRIFIEGRSAWTQGGAWLSDQRTCGERQEYKDHVKMGTHWSGTVTGVHSESMC